MFCWGAGGDGLMRPGKGGGSMVVGVGAGMFSFFFLLCVYLRTVQKIDPNSFHNAILHCESWSMGKSQSAFSTKSVGGKVALFI
jgi:hypothetical protein